MKELTAFFIDFISYFGMHQQSAGQVCYVTYIGPLDLISVRQPHASKLETSART